MARRKQPKASCTFVPMLGTDPSEMYIGLIDMHVDRPLTNLIYAKYISSNAKARMDAAGYKRNGQGQHSAKDVFKFFNVAAIQNAQGYSIGRIDSKYGITQRDGSRTLYDYREAFRIAQDINSNELGFAAQVIQRGSQFTVVVDNEDSRTQHYKATLESRMAMWQELKDLLSGFDVDLEALADSVPDLVNPLKISEFLSYLGTLSRVTNPTRFNERDIKILLQIGNSNTKVQNLLGRGWGDLSQTAEKAYDILQNPSNYATDTVDFVKSALMEAKTLSSADIDALKVQLKSVKDAFLDDSSNPDVAVGKALAELDRKYKIDSKIISKVGSDIKRLSDAAAEAVIVLMRQHREYERKEGRTDKVKEIESTLETITSEMEGKKYYIGLLKFLQKANDHVLTIDSMLRNISPGGTALEYSTRVGSILAQAKLARDAYGVLLQSLMFADKLIIDENLSDEDLQNLKEQATAINSVIAGYDDTIKELSKDVMLTMAQEIVGNTTANGLAIAQLAKAAQQDSSLMDYLYSCERVSDPMLGVMGTVIRDAQLKRDRKLVRIGREIDDLTHNLVKAGHNTQYMYERIFVHRIDWKEYNKALKEERLRLKREGFSGNALQIELDRWIEENTDDVNGTRIPNDHWKTEDTIWQIASEYDWEAFYKAEGEYKRTLREAEITGYEYADAMEQFKYLNMVERPVDWDERGNVIRTEWVPNNDYLKETDFQEGWDDAQKEYYEKMMKLKGQLGTLLPQYAQKQYLPPQLRATWMEIIAEGKKRGLDAKGVALRLLDRMNPFKEQPDDTRFLAGAVPAGERGASLSESEYDDSLLRRIPIYFNNRLREQSDLVFNFSAAMRAFASTAVNYEVMNSVKDMVEQMGDFLKSRPIGESDDKGKNRFDLFKWGNTVISKAILKKKGHTITAGLVDGFISKHIYNEQLAKGNSGGLLRKGQLAMKALLEYTSINQLAVNLKGAVSNWLVGEYQMLIEAVAGSMGRVANAYDRARHKEESSDMFYSLRDFAKAHVALFGQGIRPGQIMDHLTNDVNGLGHLLEERFDPLQEVYNEFGGKRYLTGWKKLFGGFNIMGLYSAGETLIHLTNMYAVLFNRKVLLNGKKVSLYKVLTKEPDGNGNSRLAIKPGATKLDGHAIDEAYLDSVANDIRFINQKTHGSMNTEDKGLIHRYMMGRAVMNFRQWMVEHYSRRYRGRHFDGTTRTWQEGYYNTVYKLFKSYIGSALKLSIDCNSKWDDLDNTQKDNVRRAFAEIAMFFGLLGISAAVGDPKDHKGDWGYRFLIYQIRRLIMDEEASIPPVPAITGGFVEEGVSLLNSPIAAVKTINGILYPLTGLGELDETYQKGRHKGENKYWVKVKKNTLPFYGQIDQTLHMDDEDYIFNVFDNIAWNK